MHGWRGAHAWFVRVERALHACARVQGAEQRAQAWQWRGEARCATCLFVRLTQSRLSAMRDYTQYFCTPTALRFLRSPRAPPPPCSVLLRAALCCAAITAATWGARQCRHSQKPRSCKTEWKHVFLHTCCRTSMAPTNWLAHSTTRPKSATRREAPAAAMAGHL